MKKIFGCLMIWAFLAGTLVGELIKPGWLVSYIAWKFGLSKNHINKRKK